MERLDKLVAQLGGLSRAEAVRLIRAGLAAVDGAVCREGARKLDPCGAALTLRGEPLVYQAHRYLAMNKPAGVLSASRDARAATVLDLLPPALRARGLFPVGRLDKDTVGLLLITDDGAFAHRLLAPRRHVPKRYRVRLDAPPPADAAARFAAGLVLADGTRCLPATLTADGDDPARAAVTVYEGKYHQVRRMFAAAGCHVTWLQRAAVGGLTLDALALAEGTARTLTPAELRLLTEGQES